MWRRVRGREWRLRVACRDQPVESSSGQADIEPSRPVRHDGSLRPRGRPTLPSLRAIGLRRVDSKAPCGASSPSCRRPPTLSRSHRDALPRVCNEPPEVSNIQCFRDGRPRARLRRSRQEILDTRTLKAQHSCRFAGRSSGRLLIRRSLVRAQVGEPKRLKIKALQGCKAFFIPARILEASNIQCLLALAGPYRNAALCLWTAAQIVHSEPMESDG